MLSHPAKTDESAVAADESQDPGKRENRRRQTTVEDILAQFDREFFRNWFIDGPRLMLSGRLSRRAAGFMTIAALATIMGTLFLTLPALLFPTPQHNAFFHFAKAITSDIGSLVPLTLGFLASIFSFRLPLSS